MSRDDVLKGRNSGDTVFVELEPTGEQRVINVGSSDGGTTLERIKTETTGEQDLVLHGKDSGSNIDPLRTNASQQLQVEVIGSPTSVNNVLQGHDEASNVDVLRTDPSRILWMRPFENWLNVDPVLIPSSEGILYNPGTTAAQIYWIQYKVVNVDASAAAVTVSVGADIAAGGGLATIEYDMFNEIIPYPGSSGWRDLGMIGGDDDVRGIASAADDAIIRFKIRRVDTGA